MFRNSPTTSSLSAFVQQQWQRNGWFSKLLRPLAALTYWHVERRRAQYQSGLKKAYRAPVPVIVIGNIYIGGTGKTPVVIATVQALRKRGWTPGVISRGYGVTIGAAPRVGSGALSPLTFGDEPALIARATHAPIAVHPRRARAVQALLQQHPDINVIVSDDGLQHLALARDIEFVVQDGRGIGNGHLIPAGPLREPVSKLHTVDVVITNSPPRSTPSVKPDIARKDKGHPNYVDMHLMPTIVEQTTSKDQRPLSDFADATTFRSVAAAAGIGNPDRFFNTLRAAGINPSTCLALPDHYDYRTSPFKDIHAEAILITSKDAIKCHHFQDSRLWSVCVQAQFSDPTLFDWLDQRLRQFAHQR